MKHDIVILGGFLLFLTLAGLLLLEPNPTGMTTETQVNITNSSPRQCNITVFTGLNTISFPCISTAEPRSAIVNGSGIWAMYQYTPGTSDVWKVHNPNLPSYVTSDLNFLSRKTGYVIAMNSSATYTFDGLEYASTNVPLVQGWTLAGYPKFGTENATTEFGAISGFTEAQTYDNPGSQYLVHPGNLNETVSTQGYWINVTAATTWVVS